jgi:hypothetical protein
VPLACEQKARSVERGKAQAKLFVEYGIGEAGQALECGEHRDGNRPRNVNFRIQSDGYFTAHHSRRNKRPGEIQSGLVELQDEVLLLGRRFLRQRRQLCYEMLKLIVRQPLKSGQIQPLVSNRSEVGVHEYRVPGESRLLGER